MKTKLLSLIALLLVSFCSTAQTQFWSDAFEDTGSPSGGSRATSIPEFSCLSNTHYFLRATPATYSLQNGSYSNYEGSKMFAFEDIDYGTTCTNASISPAQQITWSGINISGKTGLSFKGLFGADNVSFQNNIFFPTAYDYMEVEYRIDGGAWTKIIGIYANSSSSGGGPMALDNNNDLIGDGTPLTYALSEISANITGTGTTLDLRFNVSTNATVQELGIDNFRLYATPACNLSASLASQTNVSCNGGNNGAASVTASNGTGTLTYDWTPGNPTGDGTNSVTGLTAGTYTCTITDANNCTATQTVTITAPSALSSSLVSQTNVACNGASTGATTISASGGTGTLSYNWTPGNPSGDGTTSISGLAAGTWTCTITDVNSCTKAQTVTITEAPALTSSLVSQTNVACNGGSTGATTISASGGTGTLSYNWTPGNPTGDGTTSISGIAAGTWTCTVTDANSCTKAQTVTITEAPALTSSLVSQTNVACNGGSTGATTISASGGTGTLSYNWTPGNPTGDGTTSISGLPAGTWTCTITDANSCTKTQTVSITESALLTSSIASQTNVSCNGGSNGSATITAGGGTGTLSYNWTPGNPTGDGTASVSGLTAGTWTCTITDANSCTKIQTVVISEPAALTANITSQTDILCNGSATGSATVTASGGTAGYTYLWSPGGSTSATLSAVLANTYTVTVTDSKGCTATANANIIQSLPITIIPSQTNVSCHAGTNGTASVNVSGGNGVYSYAWAPSGGTAATASGLASGSYTVTVTDGNSCSKTQTFNITQPDTLTASITAHTNILCNGSSTGAATVTASGGTPSYTYSWAPAGGTNATASSLTANIYTVTVTDNKGCTAIATTPITQPTLISILGSQTNVACHGGNNGSATATVTGGAGSYTYSWSPNGGNNATATGLTQGSYTVTVTDANNCTKTKTYTITEPSALSASITGQTNVLCNGANTGSATVTTTGGTPGYTYSWTPSGGSAATASGLIAGTYTVTVTDANGCTTTASAPISQSSAISITPSQNNVSCNGGNNGTASASVTGGTGPYSYSWSPTGGNASTATGLAQGTYTVTVIDANSCSKTQTYTITEPDALSAMITGQTNVACNGGNTGSATVTADGGTPSYSYSWSPSGGSAATASGLAAGNYTVTVIDNNGCSTTASTLLTQPLTALAVTASNDTNTCSGINVTLGAAATGGTPTYNYTWNPGNISGATPTVTPTATTSYVVTATDGNGCTAHDTVLVSVGGVLAQANQNNSTSLEGADTSSSNVNVNNLTFLYNDDCKIIASVKTDVALGSITGYVNVVDTIPVIDGRPFLSRLYQITPQNNLPASVNLYFTQQDFDNYNAYASVHSIPLLPQNPLDQVGIDSLVVTKINENGSLLISPDSVKWNETLHFWTVSMHIPSFSTFLVHSNNVGSEPLALNIASFVAKKENNTAGLYWTTASEQNIVGFNVERSNDGKSFETIGNVASQSKDGNSTTTLNYSFSDKMPLTGMNYYRLAEKDKAGKLVYTDVRTVNFSNQTAFNCYPNPTSGQVVIEHTADKEEQLTVRFTDVLGKVVLETKLPVSKGFNKTSVDMSSLSQGLYNMSIIGNASVIFNTRIVKK